MYRINDAKMFYDYADGQAVIINFTNGVYFGFNQLGSLALDRILSGASKEAVAESFRNISGCPEDISERLTAFIIEMIDKEILLEDEASAVNTDAFVINATVKPEDFDLTMEEYSDVQEIIMADPVHEVDEEMGWPVMKENSDA